MTDACIPYEALERYATGLASSTERSSVESHAAGCETCRLTLAAVGMAFEPGSAEEEALVAWMASARPVSALLADLGITAGSQPEPVPGRQQAARGRERRPRFSVRAWRVAAGGTVAAIAASLAAVALLPGTPRIELPSRALQGRPAHLAAHAPFKAIRGGGKLSGWEAIEARSIAEFGEATTVAVLLSRGGPGDWERAARLLDEVGDEAIRSNDRGVLLLAQGRAEEALAAFEEALRHDGSLAAGLFNRALALEALGRTSDARGAWLRYLQAAGGDEDAGWRAEAESYLHR